MPNLSRSDIQEITLLFERANDERAIRLLKSKLTDDPFVQSKYTEWFDLTINQAGFNTPQELLARKTFWRRALFDFLKNLEETGKNKKIFFIYSQPANLIELDFGKEIKSIRVMKDNKDKSESYEFTDWPKCTIDELVGKTCWEKPSVLHVAMHAHQEKGFLFNRDDDSQREVNVDEWKERFDLIGNTLGYKFDVVILSVCNSLAHAEAIRALSQYTIGMNGFFGDKAAIEFAKGFYEFLFQGHSIENAFKRGTQMLTNPDDDDELKQFGSVPVLLKN